MGFSSEMCEGMYALAHEVEAVRVPLTVQGFELDAPLKKKLVHEI